MRIIGITGRKFNGKDTCADYLVKKFSGHKLAFADTLKDISKILFGFTNEQLYGDKKEVVDEYWNITPRHALQVLGTDLIRNKFGEDIWIKNLNKKLLKYNKNDTIVISDIRFQNELDYINSLRNTHDVLTLRVIRTGIDNCDTHESEKNIDKLITDKVIYNTDLGSLYGTLNILFE